MPSLMKFSALAAVVALGLGASSGMSEAAPLSNAALAAPVSATATSGFDGARVELVGGRHWRHWRGHRGGNGAAVALGAAGAIIGFSALAAANAQYADPYYAPPVVYDAPPPAYVYDDPYLDDEFDDPYEDEVVVYGAPPARATAPLDAYAPPPPPAPGRVARSRTVASIDSSPEPWSSAWYSYCSSKYRSFDPETGYYKTYSGEQKFCR